MKILILGAGVVGTVYCWQLEKAGYDVTLFVRKGKKEESSQFHINCLDRRSKKPSKISVVYRPRVVEDFSPDDEYSLIIVCVKYNQLDSILPKLSSSAGGANILFMQNLWSEELIDQYLKQEQYFFAFPSVGGGKTGNNIECFLTSSMLIGEADKKVSQRIKQAEAMFEKSGFRADISNDIMTWLVTHYVWAASFLGGVLKAGSIETLAKNRKIIKVAYLAMREGFEVCRKRGYEVKNMEPQKLYDSVPLFILTFLSQKALKKAEIRNMVKSHIAHSPDEMLKMFYDVLNCGAENNVEMPNFLSFKECVDAYFNGLEGKQIQ